MNTTNEKYNRAVQQKIESRLGLPETANTFTSQSAQAVWDSFCVTGHFKTSQPGSNQNRPL